MWICLKLVLKFEPIYDQWPLLLIRDERNQHWVNMDSYTIIHARTPEVVYPKLRWFAETDVQVMAWMSNYVLSYMDASTVKPVYNDHLYNNIYYLWFIQ